MHIRVFVELVDADAAVVGCTPRIEALAIVVVIAVVAMFTSDACIPSSSSTGNSNSPERFLRRVSFAHDVEEPEEARDLRLDRQFISTGR